MLTGDRTHTVPIPHEEGETVELKELSGRQLRKVRKARLRDVIQDAKDMGPEMMKSLQGIDREDVEAAAMDPLAEYNIDALLEEGLVGWSYDAEVNSDTIGQLDPKTERFVALELVGAEEDEAEKKD